MSHMSPITEFEPSNGGFSFEELGEFDTLSVAGSCFPSFPTACIFYEVIYGKTTDIEV